MTALVLTFGQKLSMTRHCVLHVCLAGTLLKFRQGRQTKTSRLIFEKTHGLHQLYIFFFTVLNSSTQNIQFPKSQTHYT